MRDIDDAKHAIEEVGNLVIEENRKEAAKATHLENELDELSSRHRELSLQFRRNDRELTSFRAQEAAKSSVRTAGTQASLHLPPEARAQAVQTDLRPVAVSVATQTGARGPDGLSGRPMPVSFSVAVQAGTPKDLLRSKKRDGPDPALLAAVGSLVEAKLAAFRGELLRDASLGLRARGPGNALDLGRNREAERTSVLSIEEVRPRMAVSGALLLEVPDPEGANKADALAAKLRELFAGRLGVGRPIKYAEIRVRGLPEPLTGEEVTRSIAETGCCAAEDIRVGTVRTTPSRLGTL